MNDQELDDIERRLTNYADDTPPREVLAAAIQALRKEQEQYEAVVPLAIREGMLKVGEELSRRAAQVAMLREALQVVAVNLEQFAPYSHSAHPAIESARSEVERVLAATAPAEDPT